MRACTRPLTHSPDLKNCVLCIIIHPLGLSKKKLTSSFDYRFCLCCCSAVPSSSHSLVCDDEDKLLFDDSRRRRHHCRSRSHRRRRRRRRRCVRSNKKKGGAQHIKVCHLSISISFIQTSGFRYKLQVVHEEKKRKLFFFPSYSVPLLKEIRKFCTRIFGRSKKITKA